MCWCRAAIPAVVKEREGDQEFRGAMNSNVEAARAIPDPVSNVKDLSASSLLTDSPSTT